MIGLKGLEVYNSIFNITEENNKLKFYSDTFDELSLEEVKDELEENLTNSDNTPYHLQQEKSSTVGYNILLMSYARSPFGDFESYLRSVVDLDEEDIESLLQQYIQICHL